MSNKEQIAVLQLVDLSMKDNEWKTVEEMLPRLELRTKRQSGFVIRSLQQGAPTSTIEFLLNNGCDVNEINTKFYPHSPLIFACRENKPNYVKLLLGFNANINVKVGPEGQTALHVAVMHGNFTAAKLLLDKGMDVNALDLNKQSPLFYTCTRANTAAMAHLLLASGANANLIDASKHTPMYYAVQNELYAVLEELLLGGASCKEQTEDGNLLGYVTARCDLMGSSLAMRLVTLLLEKGVDGDNRENIDSIPPLLSACEHEDQHGVVEILIRHGVGLYDDYAMTTALDTAVEHNATVPTLELLLQAGADPAAANVLYSTLERAVAEGENENVMLLIRAGAKVDRSGALGDNELLQSAIATCSREVIECLLQFGADKNRLSPKQQTMYDVAAEFNRSDLYSLLATEKNKGVPMVKPKRLTEEQLKMNFAFSFCAQCRNGSGSLCACAGCEIVAYCNTECQYKHWKLHKKICKQKQHANDIARTTDNCE